MSVSNRDRQHFALVAEVMAEVKDEQRRDALATTAGERVRIGFLLAALPRAAASEVLLDERAAGQIGLAERRPRRRR